MAKAAKKEIIRGGRREGSGRKTIDPLDKKEPVTVFIEQRHIDKYGGLDSLKKLIIGNVQKGTLKKL